MTACLRLWYRQVLNEELEEDVADQPQQRVEGMLTFTDKDKEK
jgi:hypothetical protein